MDVLIEGFTKYGLIGVILGAAFWYIIYMDKRQQREREEWRQIARDANQATRENTSVLAALKQLLETTREKK